MGPSKFQVWLMAIRPKTLWASIAPVLIGSAMAFDDGLLDWLTALVTLFGALMIQIGTNLANDYFDFKKGADHNERIGPTRVTQAGLVTPREMTFAIALVFSLALVAAFYLIGKGGTPIAIIAVLSVISAFLYTAGPYPLGYIGLGDIFVLIFFGPVAVGGTYYVQTLNINPLIIIAGIAPGLLSVAVLTVNNLRDLDSDRKSNKRTLAVRFGRSFAIAEYFFCVLATAAIPAILCVMTKDYAYSLLASLIPFLAYPSIEAVFTKTDGPALNLALAQTGKLLLFYSVLFSIGWLL
jgi:1,4-dihydroxy-2-naphthoate octaprenyltransferase